MSDDNADDIGGMFAHITQDLVPWKSVLFILLSYIILNTTIFIDKFLTYWDGAVDGRYPTDRGIVIQAMLMSIFFILFSVAVNGDLL
jgi:hypothetical protein